MLSLIFKKSKRKNEDQLFSKHDSKHATNQPSYFSLPGVVDPDSMALWIRIHRAKKEENEGKCTFL
jgi:hypothetical protein